jgi:uncharacterized protein (DUF1800 family)
MASISHDEAAHLLRRMGFGGPPEEIEKLVSLGREGAVDYLINYDRIDNSAMEGVLEKSFDFRPPLDNIRFNSAEIRRWWFTRMVLTNRQFEEKMTLFWHNHFATALSKVPEVLMYIQNLTLRKHALDRFDTLLLEVSQDPAMMYWLDTVTNVKGKPNENFARELQELFSMGIYDVVTGEPNYTEDDVKQIARTFTGWSYRRPNPNDPFTYQFYVNAALHDNTTKTIYPGTPYEKTGNLDGTDVITIIAARRATPRFLVKKLFEFFVYPLDINNAGDKATIEKFADVYMNQDHSIKELVRAIFTSDEFFSERARFALVKNPVEFIVGAIRMLGAQYNPGTPTGQRDSSLYTAARLMGLDLFNPPDVAGWDLNLGWINTATMLNRFNWANQFISTRPSANTIGAAVSNDQLRKYTKSSKKTVNNFLKVLGPLEVDTAVVKAMRGYLQTNDQGQAVDFVGDDASIDKKVRGLIHQILSLPEFQLN